MNSTRLSSEDVYDMFNSTPSIMDRIQLLRTIDYDFYYDSQADSIVTWFYDDLETQEQANEIAEILSRRLGDTVICREATCCRNRLMTIMDCVAADHKWDGYPSTVLMLKAFLKYRFKRAIDCDPHVLIHMYCDDPDYAKTIKFITIPKGGGQKRSRRPDDDVAQSFTKMKLAH